jgi:hypothetical protein
MLKIFLYEIYKHHFMKNNYIISVDLNKIYNNLDSDYKLGSVSESDLKNLILKHYNLDSFDFTNDIEQFKDFFISKFDIGHADLILLDKTTYLNSYQNKYNKFKSYNQGLILIDLSMLNDDLILSDIDYLYENYEHLKINKIYDNYLLHFRGKLSEPTLLAEKKTQFNSKLYDIFYEDLLDLNLWQKIMNIPNKINSKQMTKKLEDDFNYIKNIKQYTYENFYSGINSKPDKDILSYENSIYQDLNSENYAVNYVLDDSKNIDKSNIHLILNKLNEYNNYVDNIMNDLKRIYPKTTNLNNKAHQITDLRKIYNINFSHISVTESDSNSNNQSESEILKIIDPNELFNNSKIYNLYMYLRSKSNNSNINYIFNMSDVFDNKIEISQKTNATKILSSDDFIDSTVLFLNELIKRKMKKLLKTYNLLHNETNILNHLN